MGNMEKNNFREEKQGKLEKRIEMARQVNAFEKEISDLNKGISNLEQAIASAPPSETSASSRRADGELIFQRKKEIAQKQSEIGRLRAEHDTL